MADRLEQVKSLIKSHQDFPKPGILFRDIFPVLRNAQVFRHLIDLMCEETKKIEPDRNIIVGLDSRGFLFGPMIAEQLGVGFVPIRKAGKLPGKCLSVQYSLEYGLDKFEIQVDSITKGQKVIIVDDLLATGGSLKAAVELVTKVGGVVSGCLVIIELVDLNGKANVPNTVHALIKY